MSLSTSSNFSARVAASPGDAATRAQRRELQAVADYMRRHSLRLVTAESCTAGLIAARLADVPGAGSLLECAYVAYSPHSKRRCLGVRAATLKRYNLTSEEVAREMACGALRDSGANLVIANTGVSDATDPDIPAGTQCFAWLLAARDGRMQRIISETRAFSGDRNSIREQAAAYALAAIPRQHAAMLGLAGS